jgi:hypothetical protein
MGLVVQESNDIYDKEIAKSHGNQGLKLLLSARKDVRKSPSSSWMTFQVIYQRHISNASSLLESSLYNLNEI